MPGGGGAAAVPGVRGLPVVYGPPHESIYTGQTRRSGQTAEQSFIARMREHHSDYLRTRE